MDPVQSDLPGVVLREERFQPPPEVDAPAPFQATMGGKDGKAEEGDTLAYRARDGPLLMKGQTQAGQAGDGRLPPAPQGGLFVGKEGKSST